MPPFDPAVMDEAHRIAGRADKDWTIINDAQRIRADRRPAHGSDAEQGGRRACRQGSRRLTCREPGQREEDHGAELADFLTDQLPQPRAAWILGCILQLVGADDGADAAALELCCRSPARLRSRSAAVPSRSPRTTGAFSWPRHRPLESAIVRGPSSHGACRPSAAAARGCHVVAPGGS